MEYVLSKLIACFGISMLMTYGQNKIYPILIVGTALLVISSLISPEEILNITSFEQNHINKDKWYYDKNYELCLNSKPNFTTCVYEYPNVVYLLNNPNVTYTIKSIHNMTHTCIWDTEPILYYDNKCYHFINIGVESISVILIFCLLYSIYN